MGCIIMACIVMACMFVAWPNSYGRYSCADIVMANIVMAAHIGGTGSGSSWYASCEWRRCCTVGVCARVPHERARMRHAKRTHTPRPCCIATIHIRWHGGGVQSESYATGNGRVKRVSTRIPLLNFSKENLSAPVPAKAPHALRVGSTPATDRERVS